jgi:hypothetical protein
MVIAVITNERNGRGMVAAQIAGRIYQRLASRLLDRPAVDISGTNRASASDAQTARSPNPSWVLALMFKLIRFTPLMGYLPMGFFL